MKVLGPILKVFFTIFFSAVFVVTAILSVTSLSLKSLLISDPYKQALNDQGAYQQAFSLVKDHFPETIFINPCQEDAYLCINYAVDTLPGDQMAAGLDQLLLSDEFPSFNFSFEIKPEDWHAMIEKVITQQEIKRWSETSLDTVFAFLRHGGNQLIIPMSSLKDPLIAGFMENGVPYITETLPECDMNVLVLPLFAGTKKIDLAACKPGGELEEVITSKLEVELENTIRDLPDQVVISLPEAGISRIRFWLKVMEWMPFISLAFLAGTLSLNLKPFKRCLRLVGILLLTSGGISLLVALALRFGLNTATSFMGMAFPISMDQVLTELLKGVIKQVASQASRAPMLPALILTGTGTLLLIIAAIISKTPRKKQSGVPTTTKEL